MSSVDWRDLHLWPWSTWLAWFAPAFHITSWSVNSSLTSNERGVNERWPFCFVFFFPVSFRSSISLTGVKYFLFKNVTFLAQDLRQICIIHKTRRCHVYTNLFMAKLGLSPRHPISFAFFFILPFVSFILSIPQFLNGSAPAQMFVHFLDKSIEYSQLFLKKRFSQLSWKSGRQLELFVKKVSSET